MEITSMLFFLLYIFIISLTIIGLVFIIKIVDIEIDRYYEMKDTKK